MKRSAKNIDITNPDVIFPYVQECVFRHYKRYSFRGLISKIGKMDNEAYSACIANNDRDMLIPAIKNICKESCERIKDKNLMLPPAHIAEREDRTTGKMRQIGEESAYQQVFDYIAVRSCNDIWRRRLALQQVSSIKKRGQIMGVKMIKSWAKKDKAAATYAVKHGLRYSKKMRYFAKLDVKKCYPSCRVANFLRLFQRDCGNKDILWLWETLLKSHLVDGNKGFMIGALVSQWAAQYMLSFTWLHAMQLGSVRRGKKIKSVTHGLLFMDDMVFTGSSRKELRKALKSITAFTTQNAGLEIKPLWHIHPFDRVGIDMMGYVVHANGKITIRGRNYIKIRRCLLRYNARGRYTLKQARRACSYKGFIKHSDSRTIQKLYGAAQAYRAAADIVSRHDKKRRQQNAKSLF